MGPNSRKTAMTAKFKQIFGQAPMVWGRAPGRVDLMGSHTDYNLGSVMTMTIDRDTWMAAAPRSDRLVSVYSMNMQGGGAFSLDSIACDETWKWTNYIRGVAKVLQEEGLPLRGMNALVHSTIPIGGGLSSSAAIEMAAGVVFQHLSGFQVDPIRMALLGQRAENQFVGVKCGILDQYSAMMGRAGCALQLACCDLTSQSIPIAAGIDLTSQSIPIAAGIQVMICDTRSKRNLVGTEYGERRSQCEEGARRLRQFDPRVASLCDASMDLFRSHRDALPSVVARRCQFILEENQRVIDLGKALTTGDDRRLGELYCASFAGARDLYEICSPSMQAMMEAMLSAPGTIGARQAGAGFGGCMVALVEGEQAAAFAAHVRRVYCDSARIEAEVYPVNPSAGAGLLEDPR